MSTKNDDDRTFDRVPRQVPAWLEMVSRRVAERHLGTEQRMALVRKHDREIAKLKGEHWLAIESLRDQMLISRELLRDVVDAAHKRDREDVRAKADAMVDVVRDVARALTENPGWVEHRKNAISLGNELLAAVGEYLSTSDGDREPLTRPAGLFSADTVSASSVTEPPGGEGEGGA